MCAPQANFGKAPSAYTILSILLLNSCIHLFFIIVLFGQNFSCSMLGPSLRIREVINYLDQKFIQDTPPLSHTEALTLDIELDTEEALFPDNSRSQSLWGALAHNFSDEGQRRAEFLRDRYVQKLKVRFIPVSICDAHLSSLFL